MRLSTAFGRAFGYYDGVLFEVRSAALGEHRRWRPAAATTACSPGWARAWPAGAVGCMVRPGRAWREGAR